MEKEETLNKEDQNLKDENSDLSKDKQASDETRKKRKKNNFHLKMRLEKKVKKNDFHLRMKLQILKIKLLEHLQKWKIKEEDLKKKKMKHLIMVDFHLHEKP